MFDLMSLEGKDRTAQINALGDYLEECGISPIISKSSYGLKSAYFVGEEAVFAVVHKPSSDEPEFVLVDRDFYDTYLADGKGTINLVRRDGKTYFKAMLSRDKVKVALHRKVLEFAGHDLSEDKQVDHIAHNTMINTRDFLRPCTGSQNVQNRATSKKRAEDMTGDVLATDYMSDFSYNPVLDFTDTWYAVVLYKMVGLSGEEMCDYNRDYMMRHNRLTA